MKLSDLPLTEAREGSIRFYIPKVEGILSVRGPGTAKLPIFYNPAMELNRDLAVLFLRALSRSQRVKRVGEPMAGCGVRGIRFAVEVESVEWVALNDLNPKAVALARLNAERSGVLEKLSFFNLDAEEFLCRFSAPGKRFDFVDLDPYGSPIPYLDACLKAVRLGGFLALTATDTATLCGVNPKACLRRYGAKSLRTEYSHELGVRILIGAAARLAARRELALKPLFAYSTNHYMRVYFQVFRGARRADETLSMVGLLYHCPQCLNRKAHLGFKPPHPLLKCGECGSAMEVAGPLWLGSLWTPETLKAMEAELQKASFGKAREASHLLSKIKLEMEVGEASYYTVDKLAEACRSRPPSPVKLVEVLKAEGFKASPTHFNPQGLRTNAPLKRVKEAFTRLAS